MTRIAIIGMACRYPDAASPRELWDNVLAGRRAFRRMPRVRTALDDYWAADPTVPDRFYSRAVAVLQGYEFDRVAYRVAGSTYRTTDLTHWLALDVAAGALADAGFPGGDGLPRERTAVIVGNTLTGEFVRAGQLRLRWPYVRRTLAAALRERGWDDDELGEFLGGYERTFKSAFTEVDEDTLAGGLSNTIPGRICNHFDLNGGGYTVDGACSSSLLSVSTAARALADGEVDVAVAGGVDLSLDPFELVGFAKTGALARTEMRVYDRGSNGFWPGEGCGMVVLMREDDAWTAGHRVYASVAGWGISSDGKGGITRPELGGYRLALSRAYEQAGFGIGTVPLFEGHGTGTPVGDRTELAALSQERREDDPSAPPAAIGTIKAMIGHTKAAAGVAGLIKATLALHHEVLPPTVGCVDPHPEFGGDSPALRMLRKAEPWPAGAPLRAGITSMGFGGINTHVVLEGAHGRARGEPDSRTRAVMSSGQDAEVLLVDADDAGELRAKLVRLAGFVPILAYAELADLAATLARGLADRPHRAAVVVASPDDAEARLCRVVDALDEGRSPLVDQADGVFLGRADRPARLGYLFPGQGSGRGTTGGALRRRFDEVETLYDWAALPAGGDMVATAVAQPRIVTASMAALRALRLLGLEAQVAVGHSLGELTALHWAGVLDSEALLRVARARGRAMTEHSSPGTMAAVGAPADVVESLLGDELVVIAGLNSPVHTVVAGAPDAVRRVGAAAGAAGIDWVLLAVSHAFHSPLVAPAAEEFARRLAEERLGRVTRRVVSTITGEELPADADVAALLRKQITHPVLFAQALARAGRGVGLFVEAGPGHTLSGLARHCTEVPAVAVDADSESLAGLLGVVAAAHVVGVPMDPGALFRGRLVRPLEVGAELKFIANPCEAAPRLDLPGPTGREVPVPTAPEVPLPTAPEVPLSTAPEVPLSAVAEAPPGAAVTAGAEGDRAEDTLGLLRRLAAERADLPVEAVGEDSLLLDGLHLSSITVGQIMATAARELGLPASELPTNFATVSVRELADALDALVSTAQPGDGATEPVVGAEAWVRAFSVDADPVPLPARVAAEPDGSWEVHATGGDPLAGPLRRALESAGVGQGVLVCLPPDCAEADLAHALAGAQAAATRPEGRFVLVQHGRGASGLARTLRLEAPGVRVTIVDVPADAAGTDVVERVVGEVAATDGFSEASYDRDGARRIPILRALPLRPAGAAPPPVLGTGDVLLVTGGGRGITAECALAIAEDTGAALAILGRSDPGDPELAGNLARMTEAGATVRYERADVTDPDGVRAAVARITAELGPVTAVLHGAGRNEPAALTGLDPADLKAALAPKVDGLRTVLAAVDPAGLRLLVTFGSIIGRAGLRGEGHYATANDWLAGLTAELAERFPTCRALCLEWSVWSGTGMGERLSVVESLTRDGVTPITPDAGIAALRRLLADPGTPPVVVVSGRTGDLGTLRYARPELPLLRFVEQPLVHYGGVELVAQAELSTGTDPYLADHELDGDLLFPAVFGLEAMAQVASAVAGGRGAPEFSGVEFSRPIVVPKSGSARIRIAATVTGDAEAVVVVRSESTGYAVDHFRATLHFGPAGDVGDPAGLPGGPGPDLPPVSVDPMRDLYGGMLFQGKRFQRILGFGRVGSQRAEARLAVQDGLPWFSAFLPARLLLGDPGMRDALIHAAQVCVPEHLLLPARVERIQPAGDRIADLGEVGWALVEREHHGDAHVFDAVLRSPGGQPVERWTGMRGQGVRAFDTGGPWLVPLLGALLERGIEDRIGARVAVAVEPGTGDRRELARLALTRALYRPLSVTYRPDGRPEVDGPESVSVAHADGVTLGVAGTGAIGCDVEPVAAREWAGLLGPHAALAGRLDDEPDAAATRVWCARECLTKAGASPDTPLTVEPGSGDGWAVLSAGSARVATYLTRLRSGEAPTVFAVLAGPGE